MTDYKSEIVLPLPKAFSLKAVIRSHGWVQLAPFNTDEDATYLIYVFRFASGLISVIEMTEADGELLVRSESKLSARENNELSDACRWMLGLDQDLSPFYKAITGEAKLSTVAPESQGRILKCPTLFEDAIKTMLTTNTSWSGTIRMAQALVDCCGEPASGHSELKAFPTPQKIAERDESFLRNTARLGYRAPYVLELAQRIVDGDFDLEQFRDSRLDTTELRKELLAIKGIGAYAAANLLLILGRYDYLPIDSYALKMVSHEWHNDKKIGPPEVEAAFERWGEWKCLAYWFWDWAYKDQQQ